MYIRNWMRADFILGNKGFIDKTIFELSNKAIHDINGKLSESEETRVD